MKYFIVILFLAAWILTGCSPIHHVQKHSVRTHNRLFQFSVIPALQRGIFDDEQFSCFELKQKGDIGLGTFNALDGEMILLNDTVFQVRSNGAVVIAPDSSRSPFAVACFFKPDTSFRLSVADQLEFYKVIEKNLSPNYIYALRVSGSFDSMVVRSVRAQEKPYTTLSAAAARQSVFGWQKVRGELITFFSPQYMTGLNVPGFHSHFISDSRDMAGHVLRFSGASMVVSVARIRSLDVQFPDGGGFQSANLFDIDPNDIHKAEK